jgi:hypothetical protein
VHVDWVYEFRLKQCETEVWAGQAGWKEKWYAAAAASLVQTKGERWSNGRCRPARGGLP